jgi:DNA replication licensing factor MCM4
MSETYTHHLSFSSPAKSGQSTPAPKNRRGDIHSSLSMTPTAVGSYRRTQKKPVSDNLNSDGTALEMPASSNAPFSAAPAEDEPDEMRAIWGTNVNLGETMKLFREFTRGFKPKYRAVFDKEHGVRSAVGSEQGEILLYETYLRRMRQTGETDLNLDVQNLKAYPPTVKLFEQVRKYPQEVIPAFDQVLKDLMLDLAEEDAQAGMPGMQGVDGETEIAEISGKVYKVRPYGLASVNMRELNPQGKQANFHVAEADLRCSSRHRQARRDQRTGHSCNSGHPRHEGRILPVPRLFAYAAGRNRPGQD